MHVPHFPEIQNLMTMHYPARLKDYVPVVYFLSLKGDLYLTKFVSAGQNP